MEEKKYGKDLKEKSSFRSKTENDRKPGGANPRFKKDSESRNNEGKSEYPRQRRDNSEKPFQRDNTRPQSSRRSDGDSSERGSDRRRSGSEEPNRKFGRDSDSRNRNTGRRSESSDRRSSDSYRTSRGSDSRSGSSRRSDDNRSEKDSYRGKPRFGDSTRKFGRDSGSRDHNYGGRSENSDRRRHRSEDLNFRPGRDFDHSKRAEERSEFTENKKRFANDLDEDQDSTAKPYDRFKNKPDKETLQKKHYSKKKQLAFAKLSGPEDGILRLNKYISNTGACSRRAADLRIEEGRITVNGEIVKEVGTKVNIDDVVCMDGKQLEAEAKVYLVLNKPKDFVTTLDDPLGRKTVMDLISHACHERVYPVGRLDRMTTGVLIFTNDGDLTKRLTHPSYNKKKIYHVFLDRPISQEELDQVIAGLELEDGEIKADAISFTSETDKTQVGIEIHSGRNRIVRRIFEHLGYEIKKLDRVLFAGITKKNIPRGKWRFLSEKEISMLKIY